MTGMLQGFDGTLMYEPYNDITPSRHLTFLFNVFVIFQIFNMLAARKIKDEINIFSGLFTNFMFVITWIIIVFGQIFIVTYGSIAMKVHIAGLTREQWIISLFIGFTSLICNFFLKFVPDSFCPIMGEETEQEIAESIHDYEVLRGIAKMNKKK
jgi:magnesium-transporting ATPase (P-type)